MLPEIFQNIWEVHEISSIIYLLMAVPLLVRKLKVIDLSSIPLISTTHTSAIPTLSFTVEEPDSNPMVTTGREIKGKKHYSKLLFQ